MLEQGFTALATVLVMLGIFSIYEMFQKLKRENEATKAECQAQKAECEKLKAENEKLKSANRKNLPYNTAEEIENFLAAVVLLKSDMEVKTTLLENIEAHAKLARENRRAGATVNV